MSNTTKTLIYGIAFFLTTMLIQWILHMASKGKNRKWHIYTGPSAITGLCIIGLMQQEIAFLAAIIGFVIADGVGQALGWH